MHSLTLARENSKKEQRIVVLCCFVSHFFMNVCAEITSDVQMKKKSSLAPRAFPFFTLASKGTEDPGNDLDALAQHHSKLMLASLLSV